MLLFNRKLDKIKSFKKELASQFQELVVLLLLNPEV